MKPIMRWAGFVNGQIDLRHVCSGPGEGAYGQLYHTKALAKRYYGDVRCVEIRLLGATVRRPTVRER